MMSLEDIEALDVNGNLPFPENTKGFLYSDHFTISGKDRVL